MLYSALTYQESPRIPGVYKITYLKDQRFYVGVTRDLKRRFRTYNKFASAPQWRLNLCKENSLIKTFSLQNVFLMTVFFYEFPTMYLKQQKKIISIC
jgi:excinuclease UvrABC nuclease subunit